MQLIQLPWLPSTEVTKTARHYGYRLSGLALTVMLLSACNSEDGFSSDDSYNLTVDGETALIVAQTGQLHAVASHSDSSDIDVTDKITWTSSSPSVVSIDEEGHYKALEVGSAVLEGVYQGEVVETKEVEVTEGHSVTLDVTGANALKVDIEYNNSAMVVDWGDGTSTELDSTPADIWSEHIYVDTYTGDVTFRALEPIDFKDINLEGAWSFNFQELQDIASELTHLQVRDWAGYINGEYIVEGTSVYGHLNQLPLTIKDLHIVGKQANISGTEDDLPPQLEKLTVDGSNSSVHINLDNMSRYSEILVSLTTKGSNMVSGQLSSLSGFSKLENLWLTSSLGIEGEITDLSSIPSLTSFVVVPLNSTRVDIAGDIASIPPSISSYQISNNDSLVTGNLDALVRDKPFDHLAFNNGEVFTSSVANIPQVLNELNLPSTDIVGRASEYSYPEISAIRLNGGTYTVDLQSLGETFSKITGNFIFNTSGEINGDLSSLSSLSLGPTTWLNGNKTSGNITGNVRDLIGPMCNVATTWQCEIRIFGYNTVEGDLRDLVDGLNEKNKGNAQLNLLFRGDAHNITLSSSEALKNVKELELLGAGLESEIVDNVLIALNKNGLENGTVNIGVNNNPPTSKGLIAKASLRDKGWGVHTN